MTIDSWWLTALLITAAWTIFFSMFNTHWIRGYRNLGILAGYAVGLAMSFFAGWRAALVTWAVIGAAAGIIYFLYEAVGYIRSKDADSRPKLRTLLDGLVLWPVMLPEVVENALAEAGILKPPAAQEMVPAAEGTAVDPPV
jgi:hypothetical protein